MKWLNRHRRAIVRIIAVLLILVSAGASYFWFYLLAPWKRQLDHDWCKQHSTKAYWDEVVTGIKRFNWCHDNGRHAGVYGDADFMAWAMAHTKPGEDISSCAAGHRDSGFRWLTNQNPGDTADAWLAWWEKNKTKSQVQWICDGFRSQGITVNIPPSPSDAVPLLTLLGNMNVDENESPEIPEYFKYNAFRWLRDSGFNPVAFALENVTDSSDEKIKIGLLEYRKFEERFPRKERVGTLSFGEKDEDSAHECMIHSFQYRAIFNGLSFGPLLLGLLLFLWTFKKTKPSVP